MPTEKLTRDNYHILIDELKASADGKYRDFHASLVPNEEKGRILGVRMPRLREIAKEISKTDPRGFLKICGDNYYEERLLRAIVTCLIKPADFADLCALSDGMLPYVNSWAVCDTFCSGFKKIKKYRAEFFDHIGEYLDGNEWEQRVALVIMLCHYLDGKYIDRVLERTDRVHSGAYYVKMAQAWLMATALAKCPEPALRYYENNSLDRDVFNKAVQKAVESRRIDDETKKYLRALQST